MSTLSTVAFSLVFAFFTLIFGLQMFVRLRAKAMQGKPLPQLPGPLGREISRSPRALLYFFSPGCAACRPLTPAMQELRNKNGAVHLVNVAQDLSLAQALKVMATPTVIEIASGKVVGIHIGPPPAAVIERFS